MNAKLTVLMLLCVGVSGCAAHVRNVDRGYVPSHAALIIYSTRVEDRCRGSIASLSLLYEYLKDGNSEEGWIILKNALMSSDFDDREGQFFMVEWPASEYTFTNVQYSSTKVGSVKTQSAYEVRARFEEGKAYYLGEFQATLPDCRSVVLSLKDEYQRDGKVFDEQMDGLTSAALIRGVLPFGVWSTR